uniref:Uncharacterized protein n=1 Tax=Ciona intestinalis TaxID=7719 RepID=F6YHA6_CIOIN
MNQCEWGKLYTNVAESLLKFSDEEVPDTKSLKHEKSSFVVRRSDGEYIPVHVCPTCLDHVSYNALNPTHVTPVSELVTHLTAMLYVNASQPSDASSSDETDVAQHCTTVVVTDDNAPPVAVERGSTTMVIVTDDE